MNRRAVQYKINKIMLTVANAGLLKQSPRKRTSIWLCLVSVTLSVIESMLYLPTTMSSRSVACGLIRVQMSMVNKVLLLLKMEAKEDMRAASITASIRPRKPGQKRDRKQSRGHVRQNNLLLLFF